MATVTYIAKRSIATGHAVDVQYSINFPIIDLLDGRRRFEKSRSVSIGGNHETYMHRIEKTTEIKFAPIDESDVMYEYMIEFIDSIGGDEVFSIDVKGTPGNVINPISYILDSDRIQPERIKGTRLKLISFEARVVQ